MKSLVRIGASIGALGLIAAMWEPAFAMSEFNNKQDAWSIGQMGFTAFMIVGALGILYVIWSTD